MSATSATLLVVDDDAEVREVIGDFLRDLGYGVLLADGGVEALVVLAKHREIQLMLTDIRMPNMDGDELAEIVTTRHPTVKIILMSGYASSGLHKFHLLRKPFRMQLLRSTIFDELSQTTSPLPTESCGKSL